MKASDSTADEFDRLAKTISRDQRVDPPEVAKANRFGSKGLKVERKLFAFRSSKGTLVVKLPKDRVDELVKGGIGERYDPGHGRLMKEWVALRPADEPACAAYMGEARSFVGARANGS